MNSSQYKRDLRGKLLARYDTEGRTLPWRIRPEDRAAGRAADPYTIWLSEIMCQQTTVAAVIPYWQKFVSRWPRIADLASAPIDDVLSAWAGLGYYARARNLHKCANVIVRDYDGRFPVSEAALLKLPGIGRYTAAAIAAICYGAPSNVVDGNVERVMSRLYAVETPLPGGKSELYELAGRLVAKDRARDYPQALMDLGAIVCRPKSPKCGSCPWAEHCAGLKTGDPAQYPRRAAKRPRPKRYGAVFYLENDGEILLRKRPSQGLLGGMAELPGTEWTDVKPPADIWLAAAPMLRNWQAVPDPVVHVFTHFELTLQVYTAQGAAVDLDGTFTRLDALERKALPSLMVKAINYARVFTRHSTSKT